MRRKVEIDMDPEYINPEDIEEEEEWEDDTTSDVVMALRVIQIQLLVVVALLGCILGAVLSP